MRAEQWPPVADVLPHSGRMVWLSRILAHGPQTTVCAVDVDAGSPFCGPDGVPSWVGVEYMAQCIAAHGGLIARSRGERVRRGLLVGSRSVTFDVTEFAVGRQLVVSARHVRGGGGLMAFDCAIHDERGDRTLAEGRLNVYVLGAGRGDAPSS